MWQDLTTSLKATLFERTTSPLGGALLLSWLLWNWKLIALLVFGVGMTMPERLAAVEADGLLWWGPLAVFPLISGVLTFFGWPWLSVKAYEYSSGMEAKQRKVRDGHEDSRRLTIEQSLALIGQHGNQRLTLQAQLDESDKRWREAADDRDKTAQDLGIARMRISHAASHVRFLGSTLSAPREVPTPARPDGSTLLARTSTLVEPPVLVEGALWRDKNDNTSDPFAAWCVAVYFESKGDPIAPPVSLSVSSGDPKQALNLLEALVQQHDAELAGAPLQLVIDEMRKTVDTKVRHGQVPGFGPASHKKR